jgi:hypothetical protein
MRRRAHPSSADLERLLDGQPANGTALSRVLGAARAPGSPDELVGLDAARAAYVAARSPSPAGTRSPVATLPAVTRTTAGRLLALKALAALSGASLIGGAAYAATSSGLLGGTTHHHPPAPQQSSSSPGHGSTSAGTSGLQQSSHGTSPTDGRKSTGEQPGHTRATTPSHAQGTTNRPTDVPSRTHAAPPPTGRQTTPTGAQTTPSHRPSTTPSATLPGEAKTTPAARTSPHGKPSTHPSRP